MDESLGTWPRHPGLGSVKEVRPGVWRCRLHVGARQYATATVHGTERNAWWKLAQMIDGRDDERSTAGTIGALLERWIERKAHDLSPATLHGYRQLIDNYLLPTFGSMPVGELRGRHLDELYDEMLAGRRTASGRKVQPATVRQVHAVMRGAMQQAVKWEMIPANPVLAASPPKLRKFELEPPTPAMISAALKAVEQDPELLVYVRLAATTGVRRGENCALRRDDFDLSTRVVTVAHSVIDVGPKKGTLKSTKTDAVKRIALDERTLGMVMMLWWIQDQRAARDGVQRVANPFLFARTVDGGAPWLPGWLSKRWQGARRAARPPLPDTVRLHDLRHAMATRMLAAGDDLRTVAGRLGHADPSTTLRVYAHWVPGKDREAADRMGVEF